MTHTLPQSLLDSLVRCANACPDITGATILSSSISTLQESASGRTKKFQAVFQLDFKPLGRNQYGAQACPVISWTYEEPEEGFTEAEWAELATDKALVMHIALVMQIKREVARLKRPDARSKQNSKRFLARRKIQ